MQQLVTEEKESIAHANRLFSGELVKSALVLQNGLCFHGLSPSWQTESAGGEVVFNTGMTGYDAALTDPSYAQEILLFTYPLIGNYGIPAKQHWEAEKIHAAGVVVSQLCVQWSHGNSLLSLLEWLYAQRVPLITGIDTRHLTTILRESGTMQGVITLSPEGIQQSDFIKKPFKAVSITEKICYGPHVEKKDPKKVILVDCGMKANIVRKLQHYPLLIERVPYNYDYSHEVYDGVFLSNGPGNPEHYLETIRILGKALQNQRPIFGICLGAQLLALAAGAKTYKLKYGHRSHNQPVIDLQTGRCYITSQNHGYAIREESLPQGWCVQFKNLNDASVEGICHQTLPFAAVQFHPEAAPGPTDTEWLFERFFAML